MLLISSFPPQRLSLNRVFSLFCNAYKNSGYQAYFPRIPAPKKRDWGRGYVVKAVLAGLIVSVKTTKVMLHEQGL